MSIMESTAASSLVSSSLSVKSAIVYSSVDLVGRRMAAAKLDGRNAREREESTYRYDAIARMKADQIRERRDRRQRCRALLKELKESRKQRKFLKHRVEPTQVAKEQKQEVVCTTSDSQPVSTVRDDCNLCATRSCR